MPLELHSRYSKDKALAGFKGSPGFRCDQQFAILSDVVLCFFTAGVSRAESHAPSPSTVIWKPSRFRYERFEEFPWLPNAVRDVSKRGLFGFTGPRRHHVFIRLGHELDFVYAGPAHLGSYTGITSEAELPACEACFSLDAKLPRDVWLACGGYSGWQIELDHEHRVIPADDLAGFDRALAHLHSGSHSHLGITRYEEDSLNIYTNPECAWLMYLRTPDDSGLYLDDGSGESRMAEFRCDCGISLEFPVSQTTSHSRAREIAAHYFRFGVLPSDVKWGEG